MKKLLMVAVLATVLLTSCTWHEIHLKPGQMFTHHFGYGTETWIVKSIHKDGVICTNTDWRWSENKYFSFLELKTDDEYVELGVYPTYAAKHGLTPIDTLKPMDMFEMKYGTGIVKFVVQKRFSGGISVTDPDNWLWSSNVTLTVNDYEPRFYKYLGKYKAHR